MNQVFINKKLIELGPELLKPRYKKNWSKDNPTYGYCYQISEALYHYYPKYEKLNPYVINFKNEYGTHWFLSDLNEIVDFTYQQFLFEVDYSLGKHCMFQPGKIKTNRGLISSNSHQMATVLELI